MTDIHNYTSDSAYSYISIKYYCYPCQRQFSQLCAENATPSPTPCPRCSLLADPLPRPNRNTTSSSSDSPQLNFASQPQPEIPTSSEGNTYLYFTQQMMDPFGRIFFRTFRVPVNTQNEAQNQNQNQNQNQSQETNTQAEPNTNNMNVNAFAQLFGDLFGLGAAYSGFGLFNGVDERLLEEFLRNDPNKYGPAPASQEAIDKLQQVKFEQTQQEGEGGAETPCCSICQEDYKQGDNLVRLPCRHEYHKDCVSTWLLKHNSCPMCRQAI